MTTAPVDLADAESVLKVRALKALMDAGCVSPQKISEVGGDRILREISKSFGTLEPSEYRSINRFLGARLRQVRVHNECSQLELRALVNDQLLEVAAESIGISNQTYFTKVEGGYHGISLFYGMAIARVFNMSVEDCFSPWTYKPRPRFSER